jgi:hypothetical protein
MASLWIAALLVFMLGCSGGTAPSRPQAQLDIQYSPNPARVGSRPVRTTRETGGVGITALRATFRSYDTNGQLTREDLYG